MKRILFLLVAVACLLACGSKETEVTGEAFVVTQGAGSYKLGLVQLSVIPEKDIAPYVQSLANESEVARLKAEWNSAVSGVRNANGKLSTLQSRLEDDKASVDSDLNGGDYNYDRTAGKFENWKWHLDELHSSTDSATQSVEKADAALVKLNDAAGGARYFASLPTAALTATTDADGKFAFRLPAKGRFAIAASSTRKVGDKDEAYYWLIWVTADGSPKHLMLSNNNLTDAESPESVIKTATYSAN